MSARLSVQGLAAGYAGASVLRGVSLSVEAGQVVGIVGFNGVGKTTLLEAVSGRLRASAGTVALDDTDVTRVGAALRARAGIIYAPARMGVVPNLTVAENYRLSVPGADVGHAPAGLLEALAPHWRRLASDLSGGQQKLLAVASAMALEPKVLLVDEPSDGLAEVLARQVFQAIAEAALRGAAVLVAEESLHHLMAVADRLVVMRDGQLTEAPPGDGREIYALL